MQTIVTKGNAAVVIVDNGNGHIFACLYVNARNGLADATITTQSWTGKTMRGAERWAQRMLDR